MRRRATLLLALGVAAAVGVQGAAAQASTADTQARLAAARPVTTTTVAPPPPPVTAAPPSVGPGHVAAPPKPDLPAPPPAKPSPAPHRAPGFILLLPALLALVAVVRWFARRRR
jgi:hypothetical protein